MLINFHEKVDIIIGEVDDLVHALTRIKEAGITIGHGPVKEPWGVRCFYVRDPFGSLSIF
ncbi:VOC family protein [Lentibacillus sp. N15]